MEELDTTGAAIRYETIKVNSSNSAIVTISGEFNNLKDSEKNSVLMYLQDWINKQNELLTK